MRTFKLYRIKDVSGISGTGWVAEGVEFSDNQVILRWFNTGAITVFKNMDLLEKIHCGGGTSRVEFQ